MCLDQSFSKLRALSCSLRVFSPEMKWDKYKIARDICISLEKGETGFKQIEINEKIEEILHHTEQ